VITLGVASPSKGRDPALGADDYSQGLGQDVGSVPAMSDTEWLRLEGLYGEPQINEDGTVSFAAGLSRWPTELEREFLTRKADWAGNFTLRLDAEEANSAPRLRVEGAARSQLPAVVDEVRGSVSQANVAAVRRKGSGEKSEQQEVARELRFLLRGSSGS